MVSLTLPTPSSSCSSAFGALLLLAVALGALLATPARGADFASDFSSRPDGVWLGPDYWANRLQDWRVEDGRLEATENALREPFRTVHLLTASLAERDEAFELAVKTGILGDASATTPDAAAGILFGAGAGMDHRAAAIIHHSGGNGAGLLAGITADGRLVILDWSRVTDGRRPHVLASLKSKGTPAESVELVLTATPGDGGSYLLRLSARAADGRELGVLLAGVESSRTRGHVALVSHPGFSAPRQVGSGRFWFRDWRVSGRKVDDHSERACGPILSAQHTLSRGVLKMTAQFLPLAAEDGETAFLETRRASADGDDAPWETVATASVRPDSHTATFRVEGWDASRDTPYRVSFALAGKTYHHAGTVRRDPADKNPIVVAGFTGNHNNRRGVSSGVYDWPRGMWFPHNDIVERVAMHAPDVLFFSGDQVYEGESPTRPDRENIRLDYLYKWYLWCWAYRDLARDIPTITIPDDHDVYQGNIWGEGGRKTDKDDKGGYVHPADFVRVVEHTQTDNLPDPFDPTPIEQGIGVYYTSMTYGRIGFAVLEDRKFKSGCNGRIEGDTRGRADHINDPEFDVRKADVPGLKLLGDRQLAFLGVWGADWRGEDMKLALSQTVFANMATHHGGELFRLIADLDSNGWPQSGRARALDALRRCFAFHLAGDQHLASLVHHGIDAHNDAIWSLCVPSVANFYPRAWMPETPGKNREPGMPEIWGENFDGLGNKVTVYATTNPVHESGKTGIPSTGREPLELHDRMPGYGIVKLDKIARTYTAECWPRYAVPGEDAQYPGWPRTIPQADNYGRKAAAWLPELAVSGMEDPVVQVIREDAAGGDEVVYTLRIRGTTFRPKVFAPGTYTIKVGELGTDRLAVLRGQRASGEPEGKRTVTVP